MTTCKDQEIDRVVRKSAKDLMNLRMRVCPSMTTRKDKEIDQVVRKFAKRYDELKNGGMPQCKIVTNIGQRMSPYKTLQDVLNDDAMKTYRLNQQMFKQDHASQKLK